MYIARCGFYLKTGFILQAELHVLFDKDLALLIKSSLVFQPLSITSNTRDSFSIIVRPVSMSVSSLCDVQGLVDVDSHWVRH
jgi:hypothetical protein